MKRSSKCALNSNDATNMLLVKLRKRFCATSDISYLTFYTRHVTVTGESSRVLCILNLKKINIRQKSQHRTEDRGTSQRFEDHRRFLWLGAVLLFCSTKIKERGETEFILNKGEVDEICRDRFETVFKHATEKSVARVLDRGLDCFTCECDHFKRCELKKKYPYYHHF
uniref:NTR domain-containing protein n=1 Tax=Steinernema glaseri TaxID=37863 RepID=A0A1I7Y0U4_9BILA